MPTFNAHCTVHKPEWHFSKQSILSVPALGAYLESGVWRSDFFLNHLDWLRGCASLCPEEIRPVNRGDSSPKLEGKVGISFSSCSAPRRGLYRSSRHLKPMSLAEDLHQALRPKKFGTWDATDIGKRRVKHHPFRHCRSQDSSRVTTIRPSMRIVRDTVESRISTKILRLSNKPVRYRTVRCSWYHVEDGNVPDHGRRPRPATAIDRRALQSSVSSCEGIAN